jgi:hypothetical protein
MEPAYIVEVVPKPGETVVPLLGGLLREALATVGSPALGGGGAANTSGPTNLHYNEVHVYDFPNIFGGPCTGCLPGGGLALHYASELDAVSWRTAAITPTPVDLLQQIGVWGPLYPRGGKVIHGSGVIAGALAAVRGMDIAHQPIGSPPHVDAHVVPLPALGRAGCLQLAYPKQLPCMDPGGPPPLWETGTTSLNGRYLYIVWQRRTCCVQVPTCGITLPGIGGYGQNLCALSLVP